MTTIAQDNATKVRQMYELFSAGQLDEVLPLVSPDAEVTLVPFGQTFRGRDGFANFMKGFKGAFPDLQIRLTNQVSTDEYVVCEFTAQGTQTGPLLSPAGEIPPTGRTVNFTVCEVYRFENGKVVSLHNYQDAASLMRQLGLLP